MNRTFQIQSEIALWRVLATALAISTLVFLYLGYTRESGMIGLLAAPCLAFSGLCFSSVSQKKARLQRFRRQINAWSGVYFPDNEVWAITANHVRDAYANMVEELLTRRYDPEPSQQAYPAIVEHHTQRIKKLEAEMNDFAELSQECGFDKPITLALAVA